MTDHPMEVWIRDAIPTGSGRYYALLHDSQANYTSAVLTLISIWSKLCFSNREIEIARKKYEWWLLELENDSARHPVMSAFKQNLPQAYEYSLEHLKQVLQGYGALLTDGSPSRSEPASLFHHRTGAIAAMAIAGPTADASCEPALHGIGQALSKFRCIRHVHKHAANGLLCLPLEPMSEAGISPANLVPGKYPPDLSRFLRQQLDSVSNEFEFFLSAAHNRAAYQFLFIYTVLQQKLLQNYHAKLSRLDDPDYRLTPLGNYWTAMKAKRRLSRKKQMSDRQVSI